MAGSVSKSVQLVGVVDQDLLLQLSARHHQRYQIHQVSIVGHELCDVRMGPVGTPEYALRGRGNQCLSKRHGIGERRTLADAFRATDLDPAARVTAMQLKEHLERRLIEAISDR